MITATINGKAYELEGPTTVSAYLESRNLAGRSLAVALNGEVVRREDFGLTTISDGDRVEIVRPVGGG